MEPEGGPLGERVHYKRARPIDELRAGALGRQGLRPGARVRLVGLKGQAQLNGSGGQLAHYAAETGRWQVELTDGPDAGQVRALRADNLEPLEAQPAPGRARPTLGAGDRVTLVNLETRPDMVGLTGTLLEKKETRWHVRLDSGEEKLMKARNLEKLEPPAAPNSDIAAAAAAASAARAAALHAATAASASQPLKPGMRPHYCIAGSWDNWTPRGMAWDPDASCYRYSIELGDRGFESFLLLVDGDWKRCLHPDRPNACPHVDYALCGPDAGGQQHTSWAVGRHALDAGATGARYEVRVSMADNFCVTQVDWLKLLARSCDPAFPPGGAPAPPPAQPAAPAAPALKDILRTMFNDLLASGGRVWELGQLWEVVGGGDRGGILVREGEELASPQTKDRLSTGAIVCQLALKGERLHFERLSGSGPQSGWVSTKLKDKDLVEKRKEASAPKPSLTSGDLAGIADALAKIQVDSLAALLEALRGKGRDRLTERLKAAGLKPLAVDTLKKLRRHAEDAEKLIPELQLPTVQFQVVHDVAMVRERPATNARAVGKKERGELVLAVEETFDGFVRLHNEPGWMLKDMRGNLGVGRLLSPVGKPSLLACPGDGGAEPGPRKFEVAHKTVAIRQEPSTTGRILGAKPLGDIVLAETQTYHGWVRLQGGAGWMLSSHPELGQLLRPASPQAVAAAAPAPRATPGAAPAAPAAAARVVEDLTLDGDDDDGNGMAEVARQAQAEVARRRGGPTPDAQRELEATQAQQRAEEEARKRREAEVEQRRREADEQRLNEEAEAERRTDEARRRAEDEQQRKQAEEAVANQEHAELLELFRVAVEAADAPKIKATRDDAKKAGVPLKEIARVFALARATQEGPIAG